MTSHRQRPGADAPRLRDPYDDGCVEVNQYSESGRICTRAQVLLCTPFLIAAFVLSLSGHDLVLGQTADWTEPMSLSNESIGLSRWPSITDDSRGYLHVIWLEDSYVVNGIADAIFYTVFDGKEWSSPVDILTSPDQTSMGAGEIITLPTTGELAILWVASRTQYLSRAKIGDAEMARSWRTSTLFPWLEIDHASLVYAPPTDLYLAFSFGEDFKIGFAHSPDLGTSWSDPELVWSPKTGDYAATKPQLCIDATGKIVHLVWQENAGALNWNPSGIWYARSEDQGVTWSEPEYLPYEGSTPNCNYDGNGLLHMLWNSGVGSVDGRYHRLSLDDGLTWTEPKAVLPGLSGRTNKPALAVDSSGVLHLLSGAMADGKTRMFWSRWQGDRWTEPVSISNHMKSNESPSLVITNGNRLNAVWYNPQPDVANPHTVWFSTYETDSPIIVTKSKGFLLADTTVAAADASAPRVRPNTSPTDVSQVIDVPSQSPSSTTDLTPTDRLPAFTLGALVGFGLVLSVVAVTLIKRRY